MVSLLNVSPFICFGVAFELAMVKVQSTNGDKYVTQSNNSDTWVQLTNDREKAMGIISL